MKFKIEKMQWITREYVQANPNKIFLFGDNLIGVGYGGQAGAMRDEPNAIGIPTKKSPSNIFDAFFTDTEFEENKKAIDEAFSALDCLPTGAAIVIPADGLGTGLADLPAKAPKTFAYLEEKLAELEQRGE